jgi:hybrid cluster-associated redox disulfide protein
MITKDMIIGDIIRTYPATVQIFASYGLECYECQIADLETVEHGAVVHKVDINRLLSELNATAADSINKG